MRIKAHKRALTLNPPILYVVQLYWSLGKATTTGVNAWYRICL